MESIMAAVINNSNRKTSATRPEYVYVLFDDGDSQGKYKVGKKYKVKGAGKDKAAVGKPARVSDAFVFYEVEDENGKPFSIHSKCCVPIDSIENRLNDISTETLKKFKSFLENIICKNPNDPFYIADRKVLPVIYRILWGRGEL